MAEFKRLIVTKKGQEEIANTISSSKQITFTKVKSSDTIYDEDTMLNLTEFNNVKQEADVIRTSKINETTIQIESTINNTELLVGYNLNSIGLFAKVDSDEFLYAVASVETNEKGSYIPPSNEKASSGVLLKLLNTVSTTDNINLTIDPAGAATVEEMNRVKEELDTVKKDMPKKMSDLTNDKNYVDITVSNLVNYYKKEETYTQEEVNQLVGAVKGWDIVEVSSLPEEEISKSTIYLITQDNAVSSGLAEISDNKVLLASEKVITSDKNVQVNTESEKELTISPITLEAKGVSNIASVTLPVDKYYLACIYIQEQWKVIGTTKVNLSEYAKKAEIPTKLSELINDIFVQVSSDEEALSQSTENPNKFYWYPEE